MVAACATRPPAKAFDKAVITHLTTDRGAPAMALEDDIIKLLKAEGYRINETIRDALDEFIEVVNEESEDMDDDLDADEEEEEVEEE
jgi:hypothetical protein